MAFTLYTKEGIKEWIDERMAISMEGSGLTEQEARRQADEDYLIELERDYIIDSAPGDTCA